METSDRPEECKIEVSGRERYRDEIPEIVDRLVQSCSREDCFAHVAPEPIPSRDAIIDLIERIRRILYPGYFTARSVDRINIGYYLGGELTALFERLSEQATLAVRHDCLRYNYPCTHCEELGHRAAADFIHALPDLRVLLAKDVRAAFEGDPAAGSYDEIIFSYPGLFAVTVYRMAHQLREQEVPLIPRIMSEYAHSLTGIDIHPGAEIGQSFFIDHGTGVVIGETTEIGDRVRLYQGVTLGALSISRDNAEKLRHRKRHPTIEDDVIIYSGATILGGETTIGARSVVGGNVWITESVPPDTTVLLRRPELDFRETGNKKQDGDT
ncbi:MAG: serine O-acetyltransferase EpsC [Deltaproteobacteria bacterium]|nr:serine O-acetyltransferase EpsC [Deltaproteobacteria bacterium]